jgi:hypothetical protein
MIGDRTVVKMCDRETLLKEKEQKRLVNLLFLCAAIKTMKLKFSLKKNKMAERKKADELRRQQELEQERVGQN